VFSYLGGVLGGVTEGLKRLGGSGELRFWGDVGKSER
jgi:hypothetical protein